MPRVLILPLPGVWSRKFKEPCLKIIPEIIAVFSSHPVAWAKFLSFPWLYQRVRIDNIQSFISRPELFESRLMKLIEASEKGSMIGDWNDYGRLLDY